jgi:hypothetical protein
MLLFVVMVVFGIIVQARQNRNSTFDRWNRWESA